MEKLTEIEFSQPIWISGGEVIDDDGDWNVPGPDFGNDIMDQSSTIVFIIRYPLTHPTIVERSHEDGSAWSEKQFIDAVCQAYKEVYEEEGEDPGHIPGMLNRARSNGPYGIWGHDISDLILTGASQNSDGLWHLHVES